MDWGLVGNGVQPTPVKSSPACSPQLYKCFPSLSLSPLRSHPALFHGYEDYDGDVAALADWRPTVIFAPLSICAVPSHFTSGIYFSPGALIADLLVPGHVAAAFCGPSPPAAFLSARSLALALAFLVYPLCPSCVDHDERESSSAPQVQFAFWTLRPLLFPALPFSLSTTRATTAIATHCADHTPARSSVTFISAWLGSRIFHRPHDPRSILGRAFAAQHPCDGYALHTAAAR
ncbi:hypothetical protein B0H14DRAFT_3893720 [Mycena olivaceomarginata]|nr:hypothetical protein B0H14DRAFT_3893720 [Mycena olivaceomarginata]